MVAWFWQPANPGARDSHIWRQHNVGRGQGKGQKRRDESMPEVGGRGRKTDTADANRNAEVGGIAARAAIAR